MGRDSDDACTAASAAGSNEEEGQVTHLDAKNYTIESSGFRISGFLDMVIGDMGLELSFEILEGQHLHPDLEDPDLLVNFSGPDVDLLLANKAELLLALEFLTMEALHIPAEHHSLLCFDSNDYRTMRIEELRLSAITAAENVKRTRRPFHFNPMNSRERRIIHLSLRNETDIRSESTGTGPFRQVVVLPIDMPLPEPIRPPHPSPPPRGGPRDRDPRDRRRSGPPRRGGGGFRRP
jgi:spoIIIJ-associated protein